MEPRCCEELRAEVEELRMLIEELEEVKRNLDMVWDIFPPL